MQKFYISGTTLRGTVEGCSSWRWSGSRWHNGSSGWIEPYAHNALLHDLFVGEQGAWLVSRERARGESARGPLTRTGASPGDVDKALRTVKASGLDYTVLEMLSDKVRVTAGDWAVAPLYLHGTPEALIGSWDMREMPVEELLDREVGRLMSTHHRYGHDTLWRDVLRLTERSSACWSGDVLNIEYPNAALHVRPRQLRLGVDILDKFEDVLGAALDRREIDSSCSVVELSGGLDSANVLASVVQQWQERPAAVGILMSGDLESKQRRRRKDLLDTFGLQVDLTVAAGEVLPLCSPDLLAARTPYSEPWVEAKQAMMEMMRRRGFEYSLGGTGGDELTRYARPDDLTVPVDAEASALAPWLGARTVASINDMNEAIAPSTVIPETTLLAFASRSTQFLTNRVWPISPLVDPAVIRFCEALPGPWCKNKTLQRLRLARTGLNLDTYSDVRDDPSYTLSLAMRHGVIPYIEKVLNEGSVLVDNEFVEGAALRRAAELAKIECSQGKSPTDGYLLFKFASVEAGARSCADWESLGPEEGPASERDR